MKQVVARLEGEELEEQVRSHARLQAATSGSVRLSMDEFLEIYYHDLGRWRMLHERYDLDEDEFYVFDAITGTISVDEGE